MKDPFFQPFEGYSYRSQRIFSGRLLIVGESYYLKDADKRHDFTQTLMRDVVRDPLMPGWKSPYYKNLFYVLTGESNRSVTPERWASVWNSVAVYIFVQSTRLSQARVRPNRDEWEEAKEPFQTVLGELEPELILFTGTTLLAHIPKVIPHTNRPGILIPTRDSKLAYARCIYHPSSVQFQSKRQHCREIFRELEVGN